VANFFEGPEGTPYEGGIFEARMSFPNDYPMSPPSLQILSEFWHPNVYKDGRVCISILHSPGNDPLSGELPEERWMPSQTVATIMLSFQSMLSDPNISSPANIDASVMYRDSKQFFIEKVSKLVNLAKQRVPKHVVIPHPDTNAIEKGKRIEKMKKLEDLNNFTLGMEDSGDMDSDEVGEEDTETCDEEFTDMVDCPLCKSSMQQNKGIIGCLTCPTRYEHKEKKFQCGRKCFILDCGEIRPSGICDNEIFSKNNWKCSKNIHKDDPNAEDNFLESMG